MNECRVCLTHYGEDQLISPCKCRGSIQYIHLNCLMTWLSEKYKRDYYEFLRRYVSGSIGMRCELCRYEYRGKLKVTTFRSVLRTLRTSKLSYSILVNILGILFVLFRLKCKKVLLLDACALFIQKLRHVGEYSKLNIAVNAVKCLMQCASFGLLGLSLSLLVSSTFELGLNLGLNCTRLEIESADG